MSVPAKVFKRGKHSLPLSATPNSSIGMAVVNINGLLLDADLQRKTDTPVYVNNSNRRCMAVNAVNNVFNTSNLDVQVIFMVETHLSESSEIPGSIFKNMGMLNEFATNEDKAAGILCCYSLLLPTPKDILAPFWLKYPAKKKKGMKGRIMVLLFSFEEINIITAIIYGIPNTSDEAGLLLRNLFEIIEEIYLKIKGTQPNTILFIAGDFNSFSFQRNEDFYWGKSRQANQCRSLNRPKKVMQDLESNKDLNLIHLWDISKKNLGDKYFTNITKTRGVITTQTGIDHIYVDSEHANLCMDFATYEVLEVTSHKLLFTSIKNVWIRPIAGKFPKSPYSILPSYLFDSNICDFDEIMEKALLEVIGPASSRLNNFGKARKPHRVSLLCFHIYIYIIKQTPERKKHT